MPFPGNGKGAGRVKGRLSCVGVHGGTGSSERRETAGRVHRITVMAPTQDECCVRALEHADTQTAECRRAGGRQRGVTPEGVRFAKAAAMGQGAPRGACRMHRPEENQKHRSGGGRTHTSSGQRGGDRSRLLMRVGGDRSRRVRDRALGRNRGLTRERCTGAAGRADVASPVAARWVHLGPGRSPDVLPLSRPFRLRACYHDAQAVAVGFSAGSLHASQPVLHAPPRRRTYHLLNHPRRLRAHSNSPAPLSEPTTASKYMPSSCQEELIAKYDKVLNFPSFSLRTRHSTALPREVEYCKAGGHRFFDAPLEEGAEDTSTPLYKERVELPTTCTKVEDAEEKLARKVLQRLRAQDVGKAKRAPE
ncbi:hypothetical protein V8E53_007037 [Lactarius tabidus]